jgi:uncharacterized damage-inducible protein DinB
VSPIERPDRNEPQSSGDEVDTLWTMLDYYRATLLTKCAALGDDELRTRAVPPSNLSLLGILRHMSDVEVFWFGHRFLGLDVNYFFDPEMVGADFDDLSMSTGDDVAEKYLQCVELVRGWTAGKSLDTLSSLADPSREPVNLRFIVVHLIEEYARHCGHADLLREVLDGEIGD